jgi:hypothetical protein
VKLTAFEYLHITLGAEQKTSNLKSIVGNLYACRYVAAKWNVENRYSEHEYYRDWKKSVISKRDSISMRRKYLILSPAQLPIYAAIHSP